MKSKRSSSDFQTTLLQGVMPQQLTVLRRANKPVFDVCHVGVILRAVLLVYGALAIGAMFDSLSITDWLMRSALLSILTLPCVLTWLLVACAAKRSLMTSSKYGQWIWATVLGTLCGFMGWAIAHQLRLLTSIDPPLIASMFSGAALGIILSGWLQIRAASLAPAIVTARLVELQSRIRPHFLFNTLNTALSLIRANPAQAEDVLQDLADLFRHALEEVRDSVSFAQEIALAKQYLGIEQIRFGSRLRLHWDLDSRADNARLPPLLLQPLVENAVRHGVEPNANGGDVHIRSWVSRGMAWISIANTVGLSTAMPGHGIALPNVRERLILMHDVSARFDLKKKPHFFTVKLGVPL